MGDRKANMRTLRSRAAVKAEVPITTDSVETATKSKITKPKVKAQGKMVSVTENVKVKKQSVKSKIKNELEIKSEPLCDDEKPTVADDYNLKSQKPQRKNSKSPRKRKLIENDAVKTEKVVKVESARESIQDIEDIWQPENWRVVLDNILKMRKMYVAPVDSLGCEECPEKDVKPEVFRYQTLISVMLSSQTRDEVTFAATQRLIEHGLTVDSILATPDEKIGELIYPAGFWKSKIRFIKNTTQILKDQYNGDIPRTFKELCKLPGVGPKMANIVMSVAWNDTVGIAVDTHVHRISNRLGWVPKPTKEPEETRKALEKWLPKVLWKDVSLDLVGFGQTICKPIKPKCADCLNNNLCPSSTCKGK
ncbi:Endonuclease III-like protein 1 [Araneus ventricosus]|uniref:Endonuclease III homolog n=1 Tax=Araneus ventricosus TaxID=182803 RepID=A0A4Y2DXX6_ARAVE|nr:Endonuclease III-like protein 1 [Araneus ventricosus]